MMEVSGTVVALSEQISLENITGYLFMLYNADMEMHFYILVHYKVMKEWKKFHVNQYCKFSDLKVGILQTSSSGEIILLKTTEASTFSFMDDLQIEEHLMEKNLNSVISVQGINRFISCSSPLECGFVSYRGHVTKIQNSELGMYELDSKVLLCSSFNPGCRVPAEGTEVIVSNVHLIKSYMGVPVLVCCGLSCVKPSKPKDIDTDLHGVSNGPYFSNFCIQYGLNIFDLLWFERLLSRLKEKFISLISDVEVLIQQDSSFLTSTLEYFLPLENETRKTKLSLVEEFLSSPHQCFPFLKNRLPTSCCVPNLSKVLDDVIKNAFWVEAGPRWKLCVGSPVNMVIIGILYVSFDGNFYVADGTLKIPIILSEDCDDCCCDQSTLKDLSNFFKAFVVAIQEYDIIVEKTSCKNGVEKSIQYLRTSFCRLYSLFPLFKSTSNDSLLKFSCEFQKSIDDDEKGDHFHKNSEETRRRFLVLSKIWTVQNKAPYSSCVLVLLLSENSERISDFSFENRSLLEDTFNFNDPKDDVEFANLIEKLDFLRIEDKECKIGYLSFEDTSEENIVLPGHVYYMHPKESSINFNQKYHKMFTWRLTPDTKIVHDPACAGNHGIEDYEGTEFHGIKEIISKRQLNQNWFVTCVLQDKAYEDEGKWRSTLCMVVRSEESSMKVYVPHFAGSLLGLLPGVRLQLFGFLCFCSQSSTLYLRPSSLFGIQVQHQKAFSRKCKPEQIPNSPENELFFSPCQTGVTFHCPLQSLCFVVKIMSVEFFSACWECGRRERCACCCQRKIRVQLCALLDDGKKLLLAHCLDEVAKKILNMSAKEWQALVSYVQSSHQSLKISDKVPWCKSALQPFMHQVLNTYCSSKATSRKLWFEYIYIPTPYSSPSDLPWILCRTIEEVNHQKHMKSLYLKLTNNYSKKCL